MQRRGLLLFAGAVLSLGCASDEVAEQWQGPGMDAGSSAGADGVSSSSGDPGSSSSEGATSSDESTEGDGPPPELVEVGHEREFRGAWIATVFNINFPSSTGLPVQAMQEELQAFVDVAVDTNLNALILQVRPEADALYASDLEPWSRYLTGTQGADPGFDPLQDFIERAHASGIEVHAWLNPYRAAANRSVSPVAPHIATQYPEFAYDYGSSLLWMDPAAEPVKEHNVDVILDLVDRYDVDGIHFDDYFYPYPDGSAFPDGPTWNAYGGSLGLADWRRENVNSLVELVHDEIDAAKPWVRFGISPFGIYQPGFPAGITGLNQYEELYSDPVTWIQEGWVDYIAPQLYWPTTQTAQAYEPLVEWWVSIAPEGRNVFVGNYLSQLGSSGDWTVDEIAEQIELSRDYQLDSPGNIFYHIDPLMQDQDGVATMLAAEYYRQPVLPPVLWEHRNDEVPVPVVGTQGTTVTIEPGGDAELRAWVVYRDDGSGFVLDTIVPVATDTIELGPGRWAISAAAKTEVESLGVVVEL